MKNIYTLTLRKRVIMVMVCRQDDDEKMDANLAYVVPVTPVDSCCVVSWQAKNVLQPLTNEEAVTASQIAYRRYREQMLRLTLHLHHLLGSQDTIAEIIHLTPTINLNKPPHTLIAPFASSGQPATQHSAVWSLARYIGTRLWLLA